MTTSSLTTLAFLGLILMPQVAAAQEITDPRSTIAADNPNLNIRSALPNMHRRLASGDKCHVAFLGGSITENTSGHSAMVPDWLRKKFQRTEFQVTNVGWGSTCSTSGAFRLVSQVFSKGTVDLLVVEFAVNDDQDAAHAKRECIRGMEGIIRQVHRDHPETDVIMVQYVNPSILRKLQAGDTPIPIAAHEAVAENYGVISVNVAAEVADAVTAERYTWKDYGGTHPGRFGYQIASNMITAAIEAGLAKAKLDPQPKKKIRPPLDAGSYDRAGFVAVQTAKIPSSDDWRTGKVSRALLPLGGIRSQYEAFEVLRGEKIGTELTLDFEGRTIGAFILAGPDAGMVETSINGSEFVKQDLFHRYSGGLNYPRSVIFATDLKPGKHQLKLRIANDKNPKSKGHAVSILFFEVNR